jgi:radical SAM protein with 4Fe4S-binding SPASM domain
MTNKINKFFMTPDEEKNQRREKARQWLMEPGNNFCSMPYAHMAIEANGQIRPCCMGEPLDLNISNKTIGEVFTHEVREDFVKSFDRNEQHSSCKACWQEPLNKFNTRVKFSSTDEMMLITEAVMNGEKPQRKLRWLEVKPGNRCNLKCRICGVHNSSMWTKDYHAMTEMMRHEMKGFAPVKFKESEEYKYTQQCEWIDEPQIWKDIKGLDELSMIHFMGGEPFMVPEHFQLLQRLIDDPKIDTSQIFIRYNTNGTYRPTEELINIWNHFMRVQFLVSIDDFGPRFEYQRKLAVWDEAKLNLQKMKRMAQESWQEETGVWQYSTIIDVTVSIFNIWNVGEISDEFARLGHPLNTDMNHFVTGGWNDCRILPQPIKDHITEMHKDHENAWVHQALRYMNQDPLPHKFHDITLFYKNMMYMDARRNERFVDLWPELYHMITQYVDWEKVDQWKELKETKYEQKNIQ